MNFSLTCPSQPLARYFSQQKVIFRGIPAREIKFYTSEAYMCRKTNGVMTICPERSGHFRRLGRQSSDILAVASAKQRSNFLIWCVNDRHERCAANPVWAVVISLMRRRSDETAKRTSRAKAPSRKAHLVPVPNGGAENTAITGYPERVLKIHRSCTATGVKIRPISGAALILVVTPASSRHQSRQSLSWAKRSKEWWRYARIRTAPSQGWPGKLRLAARRGP